MTQAVLESTRTAPPFAAARLQAQGKGGGEELGVPPAEEEELPHAGGGSMENRGLGEDVEIPPTEDQLPYSDGVPMESERHFLQMSLLLESLKLAWKERDDFYAGGDMFVYFSLDQTKGRDFRGPDFFVVLDVPRRERKSWVVWQEGKGPDLVLELLSESTAEVDRGEKKEVYEKQLRVPEYYWYDPFTQELAGFYLQGGRYVALEGDGGTGLTSRLLGLQLEVREGLYQGLRAPWLRWATLEGEILPTAEEAAQKAEEAAQKAEETAQKAEETAQKAVERAKLLAEKLRELGVDPDSLGGLAFPGS